MSEWAYIENMNDPLAHGPIFRLPGSVMFINFEAAAWAKPFK